MRGVIIISCYMVLTQKNSVAVKYVQMCPVGQVLELQTCNIQRSIVLL